MKKLFLLILAVCPALMLAMDEKQKEQKQDMEIAAKAIQAKLARAKREEAKIRWDYVEPNNIRRSSHSRSQLHNPEIVISDIED